MDTNKNSDKKKKRIIREFRNLLIKIGVVVAVVVALLHFVLTISVNHGNNMYPAVKDGDLCVGYKLGKYAVNQLAAYEYEGQTRYGRIVATPGHEVNITNEGLVIDGSVQMEKVVYDTTPEGITVKMPYVVPEGYVFLMNDYREDTSDSRTAGAYKISELKGTLALTMRRREF